MKKMIIFLILFFPIWAVASKPQLQAVKMHEEHATTTLYLLLSEPVRYKSFALENPKRLILDIEDAVSRARLGSYKTQQLSDVRLGYPKPHCLRIVLDLSNNVFYKVTAERNNQKIKVVLSGQSTKKIVENKSNKMKRPLIIVVDPGHGGKDPGALGPEGTREKDVVLSMARMLAELINDDPNMHAVLTRQGDYFVSLRQRLMMARRYKADLFIAIHADSYFNDQAAGASVYSLSNHGASSVAARWLAERENHSELDGVDLNELEDQSVLLRSVLLDLAQTATTTASLRFGANLLRSLDDVTTLHYTRVEQAPFMVLKSPDIPSVLVETGFISNSKEEKRLRNPAHQFKMASALFEGIQQFQTRYLVEKVS